MRNIRKIGPPNDKSVLTMGNQYFMRFYNVQAYRRGNIVSFWTPDFFHILATFSLTKGYENVFIPIHNCQTDFTFQVITLI